jgi:uncharacterized linocin/CFP29 family protein
MKLGRENLDWNKDIWDRIDKAVHDEAKRTMIARRFMPLYLTTSDAKTVPADRIENSDAEILNVDEGEVNPIFEILSGFALTQQQVGTERDVSTAVTLATRATNLLAQAEDILIFQGNNGLKTKPLFTDKRVRTRNSDFGSGLIDAALETIEVSFAEADDGHRYGEKTFAAIAKGYANLQDRGHYGPYALVLQTIPYADTYKPLRDTLIMPADRIKSLVTEQFYGTGTLPPYTGLLLSLGGNTMDLAIGLDAITAFLQEDTEGLAQFRVYERFTLRLKVAEAIVKFNFERPLEEPHEVAET